MVNMRQANVPIKPHPLIQGTRIGSEGGGKVGAPDDEVGGRGAGGPIEAPEEPIIDCGGPIKGGEGPRSFVYS